MDFKQLAKVFGLYNVENKNGLHVMSKFWFGQKLDFHEIIHMRILLLLRLQNRVLFLLIIGFVM